MRRFLCAALTLCAVPALAQDDPTVEGKVEVEIESEDAGDGPVRFRIERDGARIVVRPGDGPGELFDLTVPNADRLRELYRMDEAPFAFFGGERPMLRGFGVQPGVSDETRERMRELQAEARGLAQRARRATGDERREAERRLDDVLGELFEVRGQARQEQADHLRERAREMTAEADELEATLHDRAARRQALIDARRAELLGEPGSDW